LRHSTQAEAKVVFPLLLSTLFHSTPGHSAPAPHVLDRELHHLTSALLFYSKHSPTYTQIYILDTAEQLNVRRLNNRNLNPVVMDNLQTILLDSHPYIGYYHHAYELIREKPVEE